MRPIISIVMPAYNAEKTLRNAILSIKNQTFQNWELIIVDDGSDTVIASRIVNEFNDSRIRYVRTEHRGLVSARNYGSEMAQGEYIAVQDADDLSMPDRLGKCMEIIEKEHPDVIIHGAYRNMWDVQYQAIHREYIPALNLDVDCLKRGQYLPGWPIYKKSLWEKKPFRMETQYAYDWMMLLDWALSGATFSFVNQGLYEYVRQENSASQIFEKSGLRQQSFDKIQEIIKNEYE